MRHRRTISSALASLALATACAGPPARPSAGSEGAPAPAAAARAAPFVEPENERLGYAITIAGLPVGHASLTTRRDGEWVRIAAEGGTNALVDLLFGVRGEARARVGADGSPRSFWLRIDEDGQESERALSYDPLPCLYYRAHAQDSWVATLTQCRAPRDPLSLLLELRRLAGDGGTRDFEVAMTLRSFCYRARFLGSEDVTVRAGEFEGALRWQVEVRPYAELDAQRCEIGPVVGFYEVVFSADGRRLPLQVRREFGFGLIALELAELGDAGGAGDSDPLASAGD